MNFLGLLLSITQFLLVYSYEDASYKEKQRKILRHLENEVRELWWREFPEYATFSGKHDYDDMLESFTMAAFARRKEKCDQFISRIDEIDTTYLDKEEKRDLKILKAHLETYSDGYKWAEYGNLTPLNFMEGLVQGPRWVYDHKFVTARDFNNYFLRLEALPKQIQEQIDMMRHSIDLRRTNHVASMRRVPQLLSETNYEEYFYYPMRSSLERSEIPKNEWITYREKAKRHIRPILGMLRKVVEFIEDEYIPACRKTEGVYTLKNGIAYYEACLRWYTGFNITAKEVFNLGVREVARIETAMLKLMEGLGVTGTLQDIFKYTRNIPGLYRHSPEEVIKRYEEIITSAIEPKLHTLFKDVKSSPISIVPIFRNGPWAFYTNNTFYVNLQDVGEMPINTMIPLALHESIPGHHFQASYAHASHIPAYRQFIYSARLSSVPFNFPSYSAFNEGWALYAESLGKELGLFNAPLDEFGRLCSEMLRACRLVIDTGIHTYGWKRNHAIEFLRNYTDFPYSQTASEVDRYITWPGQACSYKIGELKIREMRSRAEQELGPKFNIKSFHHQILRNGVVPLDILNEVVEDWIMEVKAPGKRHGRGHKNVLKTGALHTSSDINNTSKANRTINCFFFNGLFIIWVLFHTVRLL